MNPADRNAKGMMIHKLLLIMPSFFNYPQTISEELKTMGYEVDCFDDRPSTNAFVKAVIRVNKNLISRYIKKYFGRIMETVRTKKYDVVLLISGQSLSFSEQMIQQLKKAQPQAKYVLFQWDSLKNFPYIERIEPYFDRCYTFDKKDAATHSNLTFLPLFYSKKYEDIGRKNNREFQYDFCFIGTAHPKKYKFIQLMSKQLSSVYPRQFIYYFYPSRIVYFYRKIKNPELRRAHYKEFHFSPLSASDVEEILYNSRCVLDSAQAGQSGLTIRVFEAMGAKRKLITTNKDIVNYDFYREENIYVYDGAFDFSSEFFKTEYQSLDSAIYEKYSLRNWLSEIIDGTVKNGCC